MKHMKKEKKNEKMATCKQTRGTETIPVLQIGSKAELKRHLNKISSLLPQNVRTFGFMEDIKIKVWHIGKAPPGLRSSGIWGFPFTEHLADALAGINTIQKINIQIFTKQKTNFFNHHLNFKIMKKQILFIAFFTLALMFAGTNNVLGQAVAGSAPKPLLCANSAINPIAGVPYDYTAAFNPDGGTAFIYATTSTSLVTGSARAATVATSGGAIVSVGTNYATNITTSGNTTANIIWNSAGLAAVTPTTPLLVVAEYTATSPNCANDLKVWNIIPKNAFTIDIRSMEKDGTNPAAYGAKTQQCSDDIESATFNTTSVSMNMDYGDQTLYFEVIAANFTGSFTPSFQIDGLAAGQSAAIFWGVSAATATTSLGAIANSTPVNGTAVSTALTNTSAGVSIYVKVVIQNDKYANSVGQTITLAVDAVNSSGQKDVLESDCSENAAFADSASQDIIKRPTTTPIAPNAFVIEN